MIFLEPKKKKKGRGVGGGLLFIALPSSERTRLLICRPCLLSSLKGYQDPRTIVKIHQQFLLLSLVFPIIISSSQVSPTRALLPPPLQYQWAPQVRPLYLGFENKYEQGPWWQEIVWWRPNTNRTCPLSCSPKSLGRELSLTHSYCNLNKGMLLVENDDKCV